MKTCQTHRCPLIQPGFRESDYKAGHGLKRRRGNRRPLEQARARAGGTPGAAFAGRRTRAESSSTPARGAWPGGARSAHGDVGFDPAELHGGAAGAAGPSQFDIPGKKKTKKPQMSSPIINNSRRSLKLFQSSHVSMRMRLFLAALRKHRGE